MVVKETIGSVMEEMEKVLTTKTVIGEAQQFGNITLIPVVDVAFGFGAGGGEGGPQQSAGAGGGGGGGARLTAKAVVVIKENDVSVIPLVKGSAMDKIIEALPSLLEKIPLGKAPEKKEEKKED